MDNTKSANNVKKFDICTVDELFSTKCKQFKFALAGESIEGFVVTESGVIRAYKNSCPHTGVELNWQDDRFLNPNQTHIMCAVHGALFEINDGSCISGPCFGQRLQALPVIVQDNLVAIKLD